MRELMRWGAVAMALFGLETATANTAYTYSRNQNEMYEIVIADSADKKSNAEPGIYKIRRGSGETELILPGTILGANRSYKGILAYVARTTGADSAYDILTVLNGRVVLLNHNSSSRAQASFWVLGGAKSTLKAVDVIHGTQVEIPEIKDIQDIKVVDGPAIAASPKYPSGAKLVLISIKSPSPLGSGLTLSLVVEHGNSANARAKVIHDQATVIGYDFLSEGSLERLLVPNSGYQSLQVFSPSVLSKFKNQLSRTEGGPIARLWMEQITRFQKYVEQGLTVGDDKPTLEQIVPGVPSYDLLNRREVLNNLPVDTVVKEDNRFIGQIYDPSTGQFRIINRLDKDMRTVKVARKELLFAPSQGIDKLVVASMKIDRDGESGHYFIWPEGPQAAREREEIPWQAADAYLYFSGGQLGLMVRNEGSNDYQILPLRNLNFSPKDRIHFVKRKVTRGDNSYSVFYILRKPERAERVEVYSVTYQNGNNLVPYMSSPILNSPGLTFKEFVHRIVSRDGEVMFDNITPVKGAANYVKVKEGEESNVMDSSGWRVPIKTVPYLLAVPHQGGKPQRYLRTIEEATMIPNWLSWRSYNPRGSHDFETGFYLTPKSSGNSGVFIPGWPLYSRKERGSERRVHIMQSKYLDISTSLNNRVPPVQISVFPITDRAPKRLTTEDDLPTIKELVDAQKFKIVVHIHPDPAVEKVDAVAHTVEISVPFKSLAYTQILQGYKGRADEFDLLLYFKADPEIKGSIDGVISLHGKLIYKAENGKGFYELAFSQPQKIHKTFVQPGTSRSHLLMDSEGLYYWVEDPQASKDSGSYRVRKLSDGSVVNPRLGHVLQLREPDHLKETEIGFVSSGLRFGGRWEVLTAYGLRDVVPGLGDLLDKKQKKGKKTEGEENSQQTESDESPGDARGDRSEGAIFDAFSAYLDTLVSRDNPQPRRPRVFIVDPTLKDKFKYRFFLKLATQNTGPMSLHNHALNYYHANASLDDVEVSEELRYIANQRQDHPALLYVDSELMIGGQIATRSPDQIAEDEVAASSGRLEHEEARKAPFAPSEANEPANLMALIASDGRAKSAKGFKRFANERSRLPLISIMTPEEWRKVKELHAHEANVGVLDSFEVNHDFLTSGWTVWPPRSDRASADMRDMMKVPYRAEEMRVFPTLDKVLTEAGNGQLRGKQKIIIVPNELKELINKLILLRWSTSEPSAGSWNQNNRKLALHRVMGTNNGIQGVIQDNFAAMRGVANFRHSVLLADLETIIRTGRPSSAPGRVPFRLRDPLRMGGSYLLDSGVTTVHPGDKPVPEVEDKPEELTDPDEIQAEIENISYQINAAQEAMVTIERVRSTPGIEQEAQVQISARLKDLQGELALFKKARAALEAKLPDDSEEGEKKTDAVARAIAKTAKDMSAYPHLLWWIAAEGQSIQPRKTAGWKLSDSVDHQIGTILIGSEEELQRLKTDLAFEGKFFDIEKQFDVMRLEAPSEETKFNLVQQLFERPEVAALGIQFKLKEENGREPRSQLIHHFINRVDQMAYNQRLERTAAFIRAYVALKNSLVEDMDLRRQREISEKYIERLFTKVFPMPLNPDILEPNDPLNRLRNMDQAVRDLQAAGYDGSRDLKRRVFENELSQTRPTDTSKPIPDSQIFFGHTSTGKTFFLETYYRKMLKLVEYDRTKANNEDADFIFLHVGKITADKTTDPDKISVDDALADIYDLLSQPKGPRARIVFDDAHKAAKGVREKIYQFVQGLFEAKNGMITVRSKDGKRHREIPVQNLGLRMTLNPATSEEVRRRFVKDSHQGSELLKREVLATLSGDGFVPEESFLARWGDIINLDNFPRSAKVPGLVRRVRENARSGQLVMVDSQVIDTLIDRYPDAHARQLLAPAAAALTALPPTVQKAPMYIVGNRQRPIGSTLAGAGDGSLIGVSQQDLQGTVRSFTQVDAIVPNDPRSLLELMGFVMRNFRLQVFNYVALEAHMSDTLRLNLAGQQNVLKNSFLIGMSTHVIDNPRLPTSEMSLRPEQFQFYQRPLVEEVIRLQNAMKRTQGKGYFPLNLDGTDRPDELDLDRFLNGGLGHTAPIKTRQDVLLETVNHLEAILTKAMQIYLRLDQPQDVREIGTWPESKVAQWFEKLPDSDPEKQFKDIGQEILVSFFDFMDAMHAPGVTDGSQPGAKISLNNYDLVRLFSYALDKATTRLPWGQIGQFTLRLSLQSSDFRLGTRPSFREYVGVHQLSPFTIATPEFINEMLASTLSSTSPLMATQIESMKGGFAKTCEELLEATGAQGARP